jgi:hypothetical protein
MNGDTAQLYFNSEGARWITFHSDEVTDQAFAYGEAQGHPLDRSWDSVQLEILVHVEGWGISSESSSLHRRAMPADINHHSEKAFDYLFDFDLS